MILYILILIYNIYNFLYLDVHCETSILSWCQECSNNWFTDFLLTWHKRNNLLCLYFVLCIFSQPNIFGTHLQSHFRFMFLVSILIKKCIAWMHCKSLWIKASAKCINVNVSDTISWEEITWEMEGYPTGRGGVHIETGRSAHESLRERTKTLIFVLAVTPSKQP